MILQRECWKRNKKNYMKVLKKSLQLTYMLKKKKRQSNQTIPNKQWDSGWMYLSNWDTVTNHHLVTSILVQRCSNGSGPVTDVRIISVITICSRADMQGLSLFLHWQHKVLHKLSSWLIIQTALPFGNTHFIKTVLFSCWRETLLWEKKREKCSVLFRFRGN